MRAAPRPNHEGDDGSRPQGDAEDVLRRIRALQERMLGAGGADDHGADLNGIFHETMALASVGAMVRLFAARYHVPADDVARIVWEVVARAFRTNRVTGEGFLFRAHEPGANWCAFLRVCVERALWDFVQSERSASATGVRLSGDEERGVAAVMDSLAAARCDPRLRRDDPGALAWHEPEAYRVLCDRMMALADEDDWTATDKDALRAWMAVAGWGTAAAVENPGRRPASRAEREAAEDEPEGMPDLNRLLAHALGVLGYPTAIRNAAVKRFRERMRYRVRQWMEAGQLDDVLDPATREFLTRGDDPAPPSGHEGRGEMRV